MDFFVTSIATERRFKDCAVCGSTTGPFVHAKKEDPFGDMFYLCASCVRLAALTMGYLEGDEHTKLLRAAEQESETAKHLADEKLRGVKQRAEIKDLKRNVEELLTERNWYHGRVEQLEKAITEDARARLALVGNDAA